MTAGPPPQQVPLDFDDPIRNVFTGKSAPSIAADLRQLIHNRGVDLPDELRDQDEHE